MPHLRRLGRTGLLGSIGRTAVIAGTPTMTSQAVRHHADRQAAEQRALAEQQELAAATYLIPTARAETTHDNAEEATMTNDVQVFVAAFDDETQALDTLKVFRSMDKDGSLDLIDAAVVIRRSDGKVTITETADPGAKTWAKRGAIAGGLVGLIFPPSLLVSAAVGAAGGGIWGKIRDKGFDDEELKRVGDSLPPGGSAVIAIAEDQVIEQLERGMAGYTSIAKHALSAEAAAVIVAPDETTTTTATAEK